MTAESFVGLPTLNQNRFIQTNDQFRKETITRIVFQQFKVEYGLKDSELRLREQVQARQVAMFFVKKHTRLSLKQIGNFFGGRDHSTVIYAINTVNDLMDTNKFFNKKVNEIGDLILLR